MSAPAAAGGQSSTHESAAPGGEVWADSRISEESYTWGYNYWFAQTAAQRREKLPLVRARLAGPLTLPPSEWCERFYNAASMASFARCGSTEDMTDAMAPWMTVALTAAERPPMEQWSTSFCSRLCEDIAHYPGFQGRKSPQISLRLAEWVVKTALPTLGPHHKNPLLTELCAFLVRNTSSDTGECLEGLLAFASGIIDSGISPNGIEGQDSPLQIAQKAMDKFAQSPGAAEGQGPNGARFLAAARLKALLLEKGAKGGG